MKKFIILLLFLTLCAQSAYADYINIWPITRGGTGNTSGNAATVTNGIYNTDTGTVTNLMLAGSIANAKLLNSAVTVNGTSISLGSSATVSAAAGTLTGTTLNSSVTASSLTSIGNGAALQTPASIVLTNATGTASSLNIGGNAATATSATSATTAGTLTSALSANQVLGSLTAVAPTGLTVPSCSTAASAIKYTNGTGWGCNTAVAASTVTTNANLTGAITSSGNATSIASQTGTGTKFVVDTSPTLVTPVLGAATATTINGVTIPSATDTTALLGTTESFTKAQSITPVTVAISTATFTPNFAASNNHNITLVHASCPCTLANPTNITTGQAGVMVINQSATGSDQITTYGTDYIFTNAAAPVLSTAASAVDEFSYYVVDSTHIRIAVLTSTALAGTTATPTAGTGVTSVTCASAACTNIRGTYTIVGGTATTGTIASLAWTATPTAYVCTATMNGGTTTLGIGNSVATTTGMNITAGVSVLGVTLTVNYSCQP